MGILDSIGAYLGDEENRLNLASGFNNMSGNPNAGNIQSGINQRLKGLGDKRALEAKTMAAAQTNTDSLAALQAAGIDDKLLAIAKVNPELMKSITKTYAEAKLRPDKKFALQYSTPRTDESNGKVYVVVSDPNNNTVENIEVTGATGITQQEKSNIGIAGDKKKIANQSIVDLKDKDIQAARDAGMVAFDNMTSIAKTIVNLNSAKKAVKEDGAAVGFAQKWLPAFDSATAELRVIANKMGIEVINSATFGALSEEELKLAMTTAFPSDLGKEELLIWIDSKINAQNKMYKALNAKAKKLTSGITMTEFITEFTTDKNDIDDRLNQSDMSALDKAIAKKKAKL